MSRSTRLALALVGLVVMAGLVYAGTSRLGAPRESAGSATTLPNLIPTASATVADPTVTAPLATSRPTPPEPDPTYLVWVSGGLTAEFVSGLRAIAEEVSVVKGDSVELEAPDGGVIPLDALALDPGAHRPFDPDGALAPLEPGTVVLGETSASLRRLATGDQVAVAGRSYRVAAAVPDDVVAAAEIVFHVADSDLPVATDRFALIRTDRSRTRLEAAVAELHQEDFGLRVRAEGEVPWLRHADGILPQVFLKGALGEFSYTNLSGGEFQPSAGFMEESITNTEVPLLGEVVCHRTVTRMLVGAMQDLVAAGLSDLVDPDGFAGCWYPRFTRTSTGSPAGVSRHAWGAAVDINAPTNPFGSTGSQDPRLVKVFKDHGFNWGGDWALPDPMHFEYAGP